MRIKNLDTGEEYDLEEFDARAVPVSGIYGAPSETEHTGALDEGEPPGREAGSGKRKGWLKSTKKLKTWAKTTLTNVKEKIEERIEKQQQQRQLHQQQQQRQGSRFSSSFGGWGGGDVAGEQQQMQPQVPDEKREEGDGGSGGAPSPGKLSRSPLEPGVLEAEEGLDAASDMAASSLGPSLAGGTLEGSGRARYGGDGPSYSRACSLDGSVASTSAGSGTEVGCNSPRLGRGSGGGSTAAVTAAASAAAKLGSAGAASARMLPEMTSFLSDSSFSATTRSEPGFAPLSTALAALAASSAAAAAQDVTRGSAMPKASGGTAIAARSQVPPLPSIRVLPPSQPLGAGAAAAAMAPPAPPPSSAGPGGRPREADIGDGGVGIAGLALSQYSEELRIPLLEEDQAGPSSRAVPTSKSWLNQSARVVGGRRAAGRQLQQVRMVQELLGHDGPVWCGKFSADARLLATAGRDGALRLWSVYWQGAGRSKLIAPSRDDVAPAAPLGGPTALPASSSAPSAGGSASSASASAATGGGGGASRPPLLSESPLLTLPGHRSDVLDLSWSQCRLLLTASADQTARLWCIDVPVGGTGGARARRGGGGRPSGSGTGGSGSGSGAEGSGGEGGGGMFGGSGGGAGGGSISGPSGECLRSFVHPDFVTSCCFHPADPRRIVTGCADGKIRVWSVPDASVVATATVQQDLITRVLFSADGSRVVAGTLRGKARHYEFTAGAGAGAGGAAAAGPAAAAIGGGVTGGHGGAVGGGGGSGASLEYLTQLDVKNPHGSGRKVTGLVQVPYTYGNDQLYVITSADSRVRLYVGYTQERKFKGHRHTNTQIAASLSPSCQHLVCGSDDGWVYVWETGLPPPPPPLPGTVPPQAGSAAGPTAAAAAQPSAAAAGLPGSARGRGAGGGKEAVAALRGKVKEGVYEAFQTPEQTTTIAIVAPNVCRLGRGLERQGGPGSQLPLLGSLFMVAGFSGKIYVYENLPVQGVA